MIMKLRKITFAVLLSALIAVSALYVLCKNNNGRRFEVDGIYYEIVNDRSNSLKVTYKGGDYKAYEDEYSGVVVIPQELTYRGRNYEVTEIDHYAFSGCIKMTSISIPKSVWYVGIGAFDGCDGLKEIHITDLSAWCEISFHDVADDAGDSPYRPATGLYLNGELITDLVVPEDVIEIGAHAFEGYEKLRSVVLHDGIEAIYKSAFLNCTNLSSINIPEDVYYIGPYALDGTSWYENMPDGEIYAGIHLYKYKGEMPFGTSIVVKEGIQTICESAFDCRSELTCITLPSSLRCIHDYAFCSCVNLKEIYCKGVIPPHINNYYNNYHEDVTLYVPTGTKEIYEEDYWSRIKNVVEIDY